eukprot:764298-Hanusia_phi.AAC.3
MPVLRSSLLRPGMPQGQVFIRLAQPGDTVSPRKIATGRYLSSEISAASVGESPWPGRVTEISTQLVCKLCVRSFTKLCDRTVRERERQSSSIRAKSHPGRRRDSRDNFQLAQYGAPGDRCQSCGGETRPAAGRCLRKGPRGSTNRTARHDSDRADSIRRHSSDRTWLLSVSPASAGPASDSD